MKINTPLWQPIEEWHEDDGQCFLTRFPVCEPYGVGSPIDTDWSEWKEGYYTHFIPMSILQPLLNSQGNSVCHKCEGKGMMPHGQYAEITCSEYKGVK